MAAQQIRTTVLLTGGCGFIGSNVCANLLKRPDHRVVIVDNLSNQYSVEKVCGIWDWRNRDPAVIG